MGVSFLSLSWSDQADAAQASPMLIRDWRLNDAVRVNLRDTSDICILTRMKVQVFAAASCATVICFPDSRYRG